MRALVPKLDAEGVRYTNGSRMARTFWDNSNSLHDVLALAGIPGEELRGERSVEGILALIDRALQSKS
jgi:hypothetical protein